MLASWRLGTNPFPTGTNSLLQNDTDNTQILDINPQLGGRWGKADGSLRAGQLNHLAVWENYCTLFYFNQGMMAMKILSHERHEDGLEAPRNSLELQLEASHSCCAAGDYLHAYEVDAVWSRSSYPYEMSMKKLINEEVSKRSSSRKNTPNIVARLMGVDMLPLDAKLASQPTDKKKSAAEAKSRKEEKNGSTLVTRSSSRNSSSQMNLDALYHVGETDADKWGDDHTTARPMRREHPQEEELQKFKKEFEAWQAARFKECSSRVVELGNDSSEMVGPYVASEKRMDTWMADNEESTIHGRLTFDDGSPERQGLTHDRQKAGTSQYEQKMAPSRNKLISREFEPSASQSYYQKQDTSSAPTRIVILKPGPDRLFDHEDSWTYSSGNMVERGGIEEFLEEVKERLKCELQGKAVIKATVVRGSGIETPFSEKPSDPKQIARHIAKQVRDNVTRDFGSRFLRSESTRSYRSDIQFDEPDSPEFINRDARRFLSERLRNVLRKETRLDYHNTIADTVGSSRSNTKTFIADQFGDSLDSRHEPVHWEIVNDDEQVQTRSVRHGDKDIMLHREPRNLVRSLSAPVSGTSFGKLLLEDRHILTGAQIRRKHEALENASAGLKKRKKEKVSIKERVSNLRYSTLKGMLFGKKLQSMVESGSNELKDMRSGPTVVTIFGDRQMMENSTEVPPSPASVCSNSYEEMWKPSEYLSPVSTPDFFPGEDGAVHQAFQDISSNLNELRRQLNQLDSNVTRETIAEKEPVEPEIDHIEDTEEAYIRDLLVASGLYHGSTDKFSTKLDDIAKPVSKSVFQEVEKACKRNANKDEYRIITPADNDLQETTLADRKMLFDLLNEVLPSVCNPSRLGRKMVDASMLQPVVGRRLLDCVWKMMYQYLYPPPNERSLESMVAGNFESCHWVGLMDEERTALGRDVECLISGDLIDEVVRDLHSRPRRTCRV